MGVFGTSLLESVFEDDAGLSEGGGVGEGEGGARYAKARGDFGGTAMEAEGGPSAELADNFNLKPGDAVADAGAEGLGAGFLGGESGGKALGGIALAQAVGLFGGSVDAVEEAAPVALDGAVDAADFSPNRFRMPTIMVTI